MEKLSIKAFTEVNTFADLKEEIRKSMNYLTTGCFHSEGLEISIQALNDMPEKMQGQVLRFMRHIDRKLATPGTVNGNRFHKIPTIMASCIYFRYFPEQIKDLSLDELALLSRFSMVQHPDFYENAVDYLGQELLNAVSSKHFDYIYQGIFLALGESKIRQGQTKKQAAAYIRETPLEVLKEKTFEWQKETLQEVGKYI